MFKNFGASSSASYHLTLTKIVKKFLFSSRNYPLRGNFMRKIHCAHSHNLKTAEKWRKFTKNDHTGMHEGIFVHFSRKSNCTPMHPCVVVFGEFSPFFAVFRLRECAQLIFRIKLSLKVLLGFGTK
jgi:NAD-dependent SIR2 family protein deacetylase